MHPKTPTYLGTLPSSQSAGDVAESTSQHPSGQTISPGGSGVGGGVIQSQSEMVLCRRAGNNLLSQSQSFFEMPKSLTQEFTSFVPVNLEGYPGACKKQANTTRSADLLFPVKYARIANNKEVG